MKPLCNCTLSGDGCTYPTTLSPSPCFCRSLIFWAFSFHTINTLESYGWEEELRRGRENSSDKALATVSFSQKTRWNNVCLSGGAGLGLYARIRTAIWVEELVTESSWGNAAAAVCCGICCRVVLLVGDGEGCLNRSWLKICPQKGCFADKGGMEWGLLSTPCCGSRVLLGWDKLLCRVLTCACCNFQRDAWRGVCPVPPASAAERLCGNPGQFQGLSWGVRL